MIVYFASGNAEFTKDDEPSLTYHIYAMVDPETSYCSYAQPLPATINGESVAWPVALEAKEKPITPMHIVAGKLMFKTFLATPSVACSRGTGRLWTLDYLTGAAYIPGQPYVQTTPSGSPVGTGDIEISLTKGVDVDETGKPSVFNMTVLPAEPLSWGEGITF